MPPPRKVDLLPPQLRGWLHDVLKARGFGGYEEIAEELNWKLAEAGEELRIGKSALHAYGSDFREYARAQEQAQDEIKAFLTEMTAGQEVDATSALFQQLTTIAFRTQMAIQQSETGITDPKGLKDLTTALNNLIRSTDLREKIASEERKAQAAKLEEGVAAGAIDQAAAQAARAVLGFG
ncbi:MAG: phage protein Gp27 family protein [Paracoccaceae bacterium]